MSRTHVRLLVAFGLVALGLALAAPPMIGADEFYHWQRAVQVSQGGLLARTLGPNEYGGAIPVRAFEFQIAFFKVYAFHLPLSWTEMQRTIAGIMAKPAGASIVVPFPSTASFAPLAYLPQAAGILIGGAMHLDVLQESYAGRLANLACYLGLLAVVARVLPWGGCAVLLLAFIPGVLQVNSTLSADPLNIALPLLLVALVLRARVQGGTLSRRRRWAILGLSVAMALLKPTLVAIVPVVLLIPGARFRGRRAEWAFKAACVVAAVGVAAAWNAAYPFVPGRHWNTGADPAAALALFRADPAAGLALLARTVAVSAAFWCHDAYGKFAGHAAPYYFTSGRDWLDFVGLGAILGTAMLIDPAPRRDWRAAALLLLLAAGYCAIVLLAFAIGFTKPGSWVVLGVQGRYLVVPAMLLALALAAVRPAAWAPRWAGQGSLGTACLVGLGLGAWAVIRLNAYWGA